MHDNGWFLLTGVLLFFLWLIYVLEEVNWLENGPFTQEQYLILVVKNQEKNIEGIIRKLFFWESNFLYDKRLIIADLNSQDKTVEIIKKMSYPVNHFTFVQLESMEELDSLLNRYGRDRCRVMNVCSMGHSWPSSHSG